MTNIVILEGVLARPATSLELPSGDRLVQLEVTVRRPGDRAEPVPVVWPDPPAWASTLDTGAAVAVGGRVRRRFYRAGGVTQSRTEVVAERVARATARRRVEAIFDEAVDRLDRRRERPDPAAEPAGRREGPAGDG